VIQAEHLTKRYGEPLAVPFCQVFCLNHMYLLSPGEPLCSRQRRMYGSSPHFSIGRRIDIFWRVSPDRMSSSTQDVHRLV